MLIKVIRKKVGGYQLAGCLTSIFLKEITVQLWMIAEQKPLILVYFNFRGKLQPVCHLVAYLGLACIEIHYEEGEKAIKTLPADVIATVQSVKIDKQRLPLLIYEGLCIYDTYPIMAFLCRKFNRSELLGRTIRQKAKLQQILEIFFLRQPWSMAQVFRLAESSLGKSAEEIHREKLVTFDKLMTESNYLRQICIYLEVQGRQSLFVFEDFTLVDFLFTESCFYLLGTFQDLQQDYLSKIPTQKSKMGYIKHLKTMKTFHDNIRSQDYYIKNFDMMQGKSIISHAFSAQLVQGIRNIWVGNISFVR